MYFCLKVATAIYLQTDKQEQVIEIYDIASYIKSLA